jgi:hypothetical protein
LHAAPSKASSPFDTHFPTAAAALKALEALGILMEMTGQKKNRSYSWQPYIKLLSGASAGG